VELDLRGRRLRAALAAVLMPGNVPELLLVHAWLDLAGGRVGIVTGGGGDEPVLLDRSYWDRSYWPTTTSLTCITGLRSV
jgi:hypothetical protein